MLDGMQSFHFDSKGSLKTGKVTTDTMSKFLEFLRKKNEEELSLQYRKTIDFVDVLRKCLEEEWDQEEKRIKWLKKIDEQHSKVIYLKNAIMDKCPDLLDFVDGGAYSGTNPLNESQNECVAVEAEHWQLTKRLYGMQNRGARSRNNEEVGTDSNPDIPYCHWGGSVCKPRWYARRDLDENGKPIHGTAPHFRRNIRVLVDSTGEPRGVKSRTNELTKIRTLLSKGDITEEEAEVLRSNAPEKDWEPEQVYESFTKTLTRTIKVPDYSSEDCSMKEIQIPLKATIKIPVDVPEIFAILSVLSSGLVSADVMRYDPDKKGSNFQRIEGKIYCLDELITTANEEDMLVLLKDRGISATWQTPDQWSHKTKENVVVKKKITYLKEGGLPFFGSKQFYFDKDGFQYEQQNGPRLRFTITNQHYRSICNAFIQALDGGNVRTCLARDKQGTKLQAYKIMRCPILRGKQTIMKNIVIYTDLKW